MTDNKKEITVMKLHFPEQKWKLICYKDIKNSVTGYLELNLIMDCWNIIRYIQYRKPAFCKNLFRDHKLAGTSKLKEQIKEVL